MAFAQGNQSYLAYIKETVFGTTPATPSLRYLPFNTHSLALTKGRVESNEIRIDRNVLVDRHGNRQVGGDIVSEFRPLAYDAFLEMACLSEFATNVLKIGRTPIYVTIEDGATDIDQYQAFLGCTVASLAFDLQPERMVLMTATMWGRNMSAMSATPLDASPDPALGSEPFDTYSGTVSEGGSPVAIITSMQFSIANSFAPTFVLGDPVSGTPEYGMAVIEGQLTAYFENATLVNKFLNETESSLTVVLTGPNAGETYTVSMPRVKFNGAAAPVGGPNSRVITVPFKALYDATAESSLVITKS